ncbi:hypothetical protein V1264_016377 [Littorina saxatilis]|uniref:ABC-type glutathione-S-conjugate transporter n=2 Tax=Littorina saxatilis TaxID=31220 RepID=A0AAN9GHJ0_9CAEN
MWNPDLGPTLKDVNLQIPAGGLVAVVGQVGAGKSSVISAIIGDMIKVQGQVVVKGSVAYVPQQAWIQNDTVRNNILFGESMRQRDYDECVEACALSPDLDILPAGDLTEIGERGINLSGGQKQRVSLARAVYSDADVYLLDDPLSAVDSHVGKHIFEEVIGRSGLLKHKTRILVTHGVHWLPLVDQVIVLKNGQVSEIGSYDELLSHNGAFAQFLKTYFLQEAHDEDEDDPEVRELKRMMLQRLESVTDDDLTDEDASRLERKKSVSSEPAEKKETDKEREKKDELKEALGKDKLIEEEKVEIGKVRWDVFKEYGKSVGYVYALIIVVVYLLYEASAVLANIWLSQWTDDPDLNNLTVFPANSSERLDRNNYYLYLYGGFGAAQTIFVIIYSAIESLRTVHASRVIHHKMLSRIFRAPMSFFDTTPIGRIVNRFSQDIDAIDTELPMTFLMGLDCACIVLSTLIVISYSTPYFLVAVLPLFVLYMLIQRFYIPTSRQLKRLESKTRSPIYNYFGETISGASVIRAFGKQTRFIEESERRVDSNQVFGFSSYTANRWLGFRLEFLGNVIVLVAATVAVALKDTITGGLVGLSVSYALEITTNLNWLVRMISDLETQVVSVERVKEYTELATESAWSRKGHRPPMSWPQHGEVKIENLSLRYRPDLDLVLKDISCTIESGQKVGIVGRTGAGKSSLTLALFRLIEPAAGVIRLDNVNIANLGLHDLRTKLTILPQDPVIFAGSLRMNLDPFGEYSDSQVWQSLEHAHLKAYVDSLPDSLEHECGEGGENLSVGQRQLLCLARSLLRKTKVLILDEATAAVDMETDELIQQTIREEFNDCTVLTIAHRLNTVMDYDRILVLDKGEVAAFDSPSNLLRDRDNIFFTMAQSAGLAQ